MKLMTRRNLLALLPLSAAHCYAQSSLFSRKPRIKPVAAHPLVYFATDTAHPAAKGIYASRFDPATGQFTQPMLVAATLRPMWLALNQAGGRKMMYAANEGDARTSGISSFVVDQASGALKLVGEVPSAGAGPCYLGVDATGRFAYAANYNGGTVTAFHVQPDGTLSQPIQSVDFHGPAFGSRGPAPRQDGPHPHSAMLSPDNRFLIVNDLGSDTIVTFPIDPVNGQLRPPSITQNRTAGAGPRHLAFHPNNRWAYGLDELANRIDCYLWNTTHASGVMSAQALLTDTNHSVSTLDPNFHGTDTAAEVVVSPNGFYLYASNRGENSLVVFRIDQTNGSLSLVQRISCGGKGPRHFTLDPSGFWLICGNQDSASVTVFKRNEGSGMLTGPVQTLALEAPVFTLFL